jgi:hypothetical protein
VLLGTKGGMSESERDSRSQTELVLDWVLQKMAGRALQLLLGMLE